MAIKYLYAVVAMYSCKMRLGAVRSQYGSPKVDRTHSRIRATSLAVKMRIIMLHLNRVTTCHVQPHQTAHLGAHRRRRALRHSLLRRRRRALIACRARGEAAREPEALAHRVALVPYVLELR